MTTVELMRRVLEAIDRRAEEIVGLGEQIRRQPDLGFSASTRSSPTAARR